MNLFKRRLGMKRASGHALQTFIDDLKSAAADNLQSVIVFGSYASGEFQEGKSGVNVMALMKLLDGKTLAACSSAVSAWIDSGHVAPVFLRADEFSSMSKVLPIEFLDMVDHHRVVFGLDPFSELVVDTERLKYQVDHDLHTLILKLRRTIVAMGADSKELGLIVKNSLPSVWTLCRAVLRLKGGKGPMVKLEAAKSVSALAGFDATFVDHLEAFRRNPTEAQAEILLPGYLDLVEKLLHYARTEAFL